MGPRRRLHRTVLAGGDVQIGPVCSTEPCSVPATACRRSDYMRAPGSFQPQSVPTFSFGATLLKTCNYCSHEKQWRKGGTVWHVFREVSPLSIGVLDSGGPLTSNEGSALWIRSGLEGSWPGLSAGDCWGWPHCSRTTIPKHRPPQGPVCRNCVARIRDSAARVPVPRGDHRTHREVQRHPSAPVLCRNALQTMPALRSLVLCGDNPTAPKDRAAPAAVDVFRFQRRICPPPKTPWLPRLLSRVVPRRAVAIPRRPLAIVPTS